MEMREGKQGNQMPGILDVLLDINSLLYPVIKDHYFRKIRL